MDIDFHHCGVSSMSGYRRFCHNVCNHVFSLDVLNFAVSHHLSQVGYATQHVFCCMCFNEQNTC